MMRRTAAQMARKAVQLGIVQPETAKANEGEFKKFLHNTMRSGPNTPSITLLASVMHSEEEV